MRRNRTRCGVHCSIDLLALAKAAIRSASIFSPEKRASTAWTFAACGSDYRFYVASVSPFAHDLLALSFNSS
mgnify:CR=1 FL=1